MNKLASYIMAGPLQATTTVVAFASLAIIFPPLMLVSNASLALVNMRLGVRQGMSVLGLSVLVMALLSFAATRSVWAGLAFSLLQWAPLLILAFVLRYTVSLRTTFEVAIVIGLLALLILGSLVPDLTAYWTEMLDVYLRPAMVRAELSAEQIDTLFAEAARLMTGSVIASMLLTMALSLLLARWWQALLYNPGGFREEFVNLRLGYPAAGLGVTFFIGAIATESPFIIQLAIVSLVVFFLQGIAIIHNLSARTRNPLIWLVVAYVLLVLAMPQMMIGLSALGVVDSFVNIRSRLGASDQGDE